MATLHISTPLPAIVPVRNKAWIELTCSGYEITAPTQAGYAISVGDFPDEGDELTLMLPNGQEVTFTFVGSAPDDSGTQIQIGSSNAETASNIAVALASNYWVDHVFAVSYTSGSMVNLVPRALGNDQFFTLQTDAPVVGVTTAPGSAGSYAQNYKANVQVWFEEEWKSGVFKPRPALSGTPGEDHRLRLDLQTSLQWRDQYDWPVYGSPAPQVQRKLQRRFHHSRWELFGDPPAKQRIVKSTNLIAWYAGSRNLEYAHIQDVFALMTSSTLTGGTPFLTYRGRRDHHEVSTIQHHYLSWYRRVPKVADQQLKLQVTVYWTDGTNDATTAWTDTNSSGWQEGDVMLFPTGFDVLDLQSLQPAKIPSRYTVQVLSHTNAVLSEAYTFWIIPEDHNEVHVEYVNSLGVVETLRCQGHWTIGVETNHDEVEQLRFPIAGSHPSTEGSDLRGLLRGNRVKLRVSTGPMEPAELNAALDVLFSPKWRVQLHDRETRAPLILVNAQHVLCERGTEDENLAALNLEFIEGDLEMAWSDRFAMPAVPPPETDPEF